MIIIQIKIKKLYNLFKARNIIKLTKTTETHLKTNSKQLNTNLTIFLTDDTKNRSYVGHT
jgi:hypothetical protein